jgi:hypothetical protein
MPDTSLNIALQNQTTSNTVFAYITGLALQNNSALFLLRADGQTPYFPTQPSADQSPLTEDCAIPLGAPGNTKTVTIPQIAGGRIWFSIDGKLTFLLNSSETGPQLVQPSVLNSSDLNINGNWGFCEFTFDNSQLFANISYVDFTSIPIALTLENNSGGVQHVSGMPANGLDQVCTKLRQQAAIDHRPWDKLIVMRNGKTLRALSPNHANSVGASFAGYYEGYVQQVLNMYRNDSKPVRINTQSGSGTLSGSVDGNDLVFDRQRFIAPSTENIFDSNTGPFDTANANDERKALIARLAAAYNRSTLLTQINQPSAPSTFYKTSPTNHFSRILHEVNLDHTGYAHPYDDVTQDGGEDVSGKVNDRNPKLWTVAVGGSHAYAGNTLPSKQAPQRDDLRRDAPATEPQTNRLKPEGRSRSFL